MLLSRFVGLSARWLRKEDFYGNKGWRKVNMMKNKWGYLIGMLLFQIAIFVIAIIPSTIIDIEVKLHVIVIADCGLIGATVYNLINVKR